MNIKFQIDVEDRDGQKQTLNFSIQTSDISTHAFCSNNSVLYSEAINKLKVHLSENRGVVLKKG